MDSTQSTKVSVSGLETHIYGLDEVLKSQVKSVDVVFVLHGRTQRWQDYEPTALAILAKDKVDVPMHMPRGLLVVSFDHRNHGHRQVSQLANQTWADGNELHAQDMCKTALYASRMSNALTACSQTRYSTARAQTLVF